MTTQVRGMMRRMGSCRHSIKEEAAIQLVQAFNIARLTCGSPYLNLSKAESHTLTFRLAQVGKAETWAA